MTTCRYGETTKNTYSSTGGTTKFVYDGADVVRDLDGSGATTADYLNGPGIDNKLRQTSGGTAAYYLDDHLGTTRALADASGNVASSLGYDSYGNLTSGSASTRYTYTGREIDGKKVYGHMDYGKKDPSLGWRFTDAWLSMAGSADRGIPNGMPVDEWGIRVEGCNPAGSSGIFAVLWKGDKVWVDVHTDADGVWLTLNDGAIQWNRSALLRGRIEIADLKERVRKLEAIAAGIDL